MERLSFDEKLSEIRKYYVENPQQVDHEVSVCLYNIKNLSLEKKSLLSDISYDILIFCFLSIIIACIGFLHLSNIWVYIFGLIFFIAGLLIGLNTKIFGIIFLFSHGMTGLFIMEGALLGDIVNSPIFSDSPTNIYIYLGVIIVIFFISLICSILHNLSDNLKRYKYLKCIILFLYLLGFLMTGLFPYIFPIFE